MRHIILISGKDSAATAIVQMVHQPDLDYELVFNDTGAETPEIDGWLDKMSNYLGLPIKRVGANLQDIINDQGILPSPRMRFCTRMSKIEPLENWLEGGAATVYLGIRADEQRVGYQQRSKKVRITPAYPLQTMGIDLHGVWSLLESRDLLPPQFEWKEIKDRAIVALGNDLRALDALEPWQRNPLFAWRSRPNCSFCFFQRAYEWVGLFEHHPALFWNAVDMEESIGADDFTWRPKDSLRKVLERAEQIKHKRVKQIVSTIIGTTQQSLFDDEDSPDLLSVVSCGLMCGK